MKKVFFKRFFIYLFMTLSTLAVVTIAIFFMLGYKIDKYGDLEQTSILQIRTTPKGVTVKVNGENQSTQTDSKILLEAGNHKIELAKDGYKTWQKNMMMPSAAIRWVDYVKMIPNEIKTEKVLDFENISTALASPSKYRFAVKTNPHTPQIEIIEITNDKPKQTSVIIPDEIFKNSSKPETVSYTHLRRRRCSAIGHGSR